MVMSGFGVKIKIWDTSGLICLLEIQEETLQINESGIQRCSGWRRGFGCPSVKMRFKALGLNENTWGARVASE